MVFFTRDSSGCLIQETRDRTVDRDGCIVSVSVVVSDRVVKLRYDLIQMPKQVVLLLKVYLCYGLCFPPPCAVL